MAKILIAFAALALFAGSSLLGMNCGGGGSMGLQPAPHSAPR
jgi:hypothetical protein